MAVTSPRLPTIALTMGDVAGIGPEIIVRCLDDQDFRKRFQVVVVGCPEVLNRASRLLGVELPCRIVSSEEDLARICGAQQAVQHAGQTSGHVASHVTSHVTGSESAEVLCWNPSQVSVAEVGAGELSGHAGRAAYDWLVAATRAALAGVIDAIVTAPLNKAALHAGGINYPGHTEILAHECGVDDFAMMLHLPVCDMVKGSHGLSIAHVTLHTSIASVPKLLNQAAIEEKIALMHDFLLQIGCESPRIGVCALNPHGGEEGLFGDEEITMIRPAVTSVQSQKKGAAGPYPADTLIARSVQGEFDGVIAMYHDQGHIAIKLIAFQTAVNVTLGLPIVRTSPSHGTGFDIAWQGKANPSGMQAAIDVALNLCAKKRS